MRLIIHHVAAGGLKVDRHAAVVTDRQDIEQLLQVGPMVFTVTPGDRRNGLAGTPLFGQFVGIDAKKLDCVGIVVQFV